MHTMQRRSFLLVLSAMACARAPANPSAAPPAPGSAPKKYPVMKTDDEWKKLLTPDQFYVLRQQGTERAFTGAYWNEHRKGVFQCAGCKTPLFSSDTKFESGTGWPSFWAPLSDKAVDVAKDDSHGMTRDEVVCATCGGHLGHVFDDGPREVDGKKATGLRYCMNSAALFFVEAKT